MALESASGNRAVLTAHVTHRAKWLQRRFDIRVEEHRPPTHLCVNEVCSAKSGVVAVTCFSERVGRAPWGHGCCGEEEHMASGYSLFVLLFPLTVSAALTLICRALWSASARNHRVSGGGLKQIHIHFLSTHIKTQLLPVSHVALPCVVSPTRTHTPISQKMPNSPPISATSPLSFKSTIFPSRSVLNFSFPCPPQVSEPPQWVPSSHSSGSILALMKGAL